MKIIFKDFSDYKTNCYILKKDCGEIIIDPGVGSASWVEHNCKRPLAILNTHCHFDHIFDDDELRTSLGVKIYVPKDDEFMCLQDPFNLIKKAFKPDVLVENGENIKIDDFNLKFHHFPGHTPGCSMIECEGVMFSGDFLFKNSIGRCDFPFSNADDMKKSLKKVLEFKKDFKLYPGHGEETSLYKEKDTIKYYLHII